MNLIKSIAASSWAEGLKHVTCTRPGCPRWLRQRRLDAQRVGVTLRGAWYCSYRCAAPAIEARLAELLRPVRLQAKHVLRMPLGLTLVSRGWLSDEQFREANEQHKATGEDVADVLLRLGYVGEKQLTTVRAASWGAPVFEAPARVGLSPVRIPAIFTTLYSMVPLHLAPATKKLLVGFVQSVEYGPLYAIEQVTGFKTEPCFITPSDYCARVEGATETNSPEDLTFDRCETSSEWTRVLCNYGAQIDAEEIAFARCGEYVWARLKGGQKPADMLFRAA